jgi:acetoin utilization deacetylase AcuC-like enzyme
MSRSKPPAASERGGYGDRARRATRVLRGAPPGHHARPEQGMGFLHLNSIASRRAARRTGQG